MSNFQIGNSIQAVVGSIPISSTLLVHNHAGVSTMTVTVRTLLIIALFLSVFFSSAAPSFAACMSCLSKTGQSYTEVACEGDSKYEVIRKCGKPDYEEESGQVTTGEFGSTREKGTKQGGFSASTEKIEKLYFNCGQGRFIRVLTFRGGILVLIEIGERGSGEQRCW
ncbi:MAG: DUF2845 domain-containing protein [Nitrospiraceae bacterium]|nr:DUF2845 domain-containing protein [Nitrospiraceae bacterium]